MATRGEEPKLSPEDVLSPVAHPSVVQLITQLDLRPHPEGGYFKEGYRSAGVATNPSGDTRPFVTVIQYLLEGGHKSALHRLKSDEIWFFHSGNHVKVHMLSPSGAYTCERLGEDPTAGEQPMVVVPAGTWFGATVDSDPTHYGLVSCTVAPGFDERDWELADYTTLSQQFPHHAGFLKLMCRPAGQVESLTTSLLTNAIGLPPSVLPGSPIGPHDYIFAMKNEGLIRCLSHDGLEISWEMSLPNGHRPQALCQVQLPNRDPGLVIATCLGETDGALIVLDLRTRVFSSSTKLPGVPHSVIYVVDGETGEHDTLAISFPKEQEVKFFKMTSWAVCGTISCSEPPSGICFLALVKTLVVLENLECVAYNTRDPSFPCIGRWAQGDSRAFFLAATALSDGHRFALCDALGQVHLMRSTLQPEQVFRLGVTGLGLAEYRSGPRLVIAMLSATRGRSMMLLHCDDEEDSTPQVEHLRSQLIPRTAVAFEMVPQL